MVVIMRQIVLLRVLPLLVAFSTFWGIASGSVFAQTGEIRGTVKDRSGEAISGARVTVTPLSGGTTRGAIVNIQGGYSIRGLSSGEYSISVTSVGFKEQKKKVVVEAPQEVNFV